VGAVQAVVDRVAVADPRGAVGVVHGAVLAGVGAVGSHVAVGAGIVAVVVVVSEVRAVASLEADADINTIGNFV
jgi:hypothetical protein